MKKLSIKVIVGILLFTSNSFSATLCPDGSYVSGGSCTLCPDGTFVGSGSCTLMPDGTYR